MWIEQRSKNHSTLGNYTREVISHSGSYFTPKVIQDPKKVTDIITLEQTGTGVLLLDEVDLILHPLKSELNWPLGQKLPLDFTRSRAGFGLRWQIPFHILDAVFVGCEGSVPLMSSDRSSREAMQALNEIREIVLSGIERKMLQTVPHIVLLSRAFYRKELRPTLARWLLIWFGTKKLVGVPDDVVIRYLLRQETEDKELKSLDDDFVKMLNLGREWLNSLLPFVLSKINRVNFGLLNTQDLERALSLDPRLPKSRRFLAVPFIGKDVPSRSSEFSHPDVRSVDIKIHSPFEIHKKNMRIPTNRY